MTQPLDITMTAVKRPEIIGITLQTFKEHLFQNYPCRLIINVDPVGDENKTQQDVLDVCSKYFKDIVYRTPDKPHFPTAFMWCWQQATSDFTFHLEDDWELLHDVNLRDMIDTMDKTPLLASMRLSAWDAEDNRVKAVSSTKNPDKFIPYNFHDGFFEVGNWQKPQLGCSGHPGLWRTEFINAVLPLLTPNYNPEKLLRYSRYILPIVMQHRFGVWGKPRDKKAIRDIGEQWRNDNGWFKGEGSNRAWFQKWVRDSDPYKEQEPE